MNLDLIPLLHRRADQSVNESVMPERIDQQVRVTSPRWIDAHDIIALKHAAKLGGIAMLIYLSMMHVHLVHLSVTRCTPEALGRAPSLGVPAPDKDTPPVYRALPLQ